MPNHLIFCLILLNLLLTCHAGEDVSFEENANQEDKKVKQKNKIQTLRKELFQNYDPHALPLPLSADNNNSSTEPLKVTMELKLIDISGLDYEKNTLETHVWLTVFWIDSHLAWDPSQYGNLRKLSVPPEEVYRPDITLDNSDGDRAESLHKIDHSHVLLYSDGTALWLPSLWIRSKCTFNLTDWPHDQQSCALKFTSWTHSGQEISLHNKSSTINLSDYIENPQWSILKTSCERNFISYSCCPEEYHYVTFNLTIERKSSAIYRYTIHFPLICAILINLVAFLLDTKRDEDNVKFKLSALSLLILVLIGFYLGNLLGFGVMSGPKIGRMILLVACAILWFTISRSLVNSGPIRFLASGISRYFPGTRGSQRSDVEHIQMDSEQDGGAHEDTGKFSSRQENVSQNVTIVWIGDKILGVVTLILVILLY